MRKILRVLLLKNGGGDGEIYKRECSILRVQSFQNNWKIVFKKNNKIYNNKKNKNQNIQQIEKNTGRRY